MGFTEAINTVMGNLCNFNGRSRRSEFWWFMLVFYIAQSILGLALQPISAPLVASMVVQVLWFLPLAVTIRRLQDGGHSKWWVIVSWASSLACNLFMFCGDAYTNLMASPTVDNVLAFFSPQVNVSLFINLVTSIVILVMAMLDGTPDENKYGPSPKYYVEGEEESPEI